MTSEKRQKIALLMNLLLGLVETYAILNCYFGFVKASPSSSGGGSLMFRFFTEDSNILLLISVWAYVVWGFIALKKGTSLPRGVKILRYIATVAVTTTNLVVFFFLAPYCAYAYGSYWIMWSWPNMIFTHFFCPVLSDVSYLLFEEPLEKAVPWKEAFVSLSSVLLYAIIVGSLASTQNISSDPSINNVYGFMDATAGAWWVTPLALTLIISGTYGEGVLLLYLAKKRKKRSLTK